MTVVKQTRHLFEAGDIKNLRLACSSCAAEILFPPHESRGIPKECPYCGSDWVDSLSPTHAAWAKAVTILQNVCALSKIKTPPIHASF